MTFPADAFKYVSIRRGEFESVMLYVALTLIQRVPEQLFPSPTPCLCRDVETVHQLDRYRVGCLLRT